VLVRGFSGVGGNTVAAVSRQPIPRGVDPLRVKFFGVRGSCPCSSEEQRRYGGNTSTALVEVGDEPPLLLDLGTGLRPLGVELDQTRGRDPLPITALLTHLHWDHVMGLPFFGPVQRPGAQLLVYGPRQDESSLQEVMTQVVKPPFFPVHMRDLDGSMRFEEVGAESFAVGSATVTSREVPHIGTTLGFRIEAEGRSLVYISDHQAPPDRRGVAAGVLELCDGADLVIHDGQYTAEEFAGVKGTWGHSTVDYAVQVAAEAGAKRLIIFHHDPAHTDAEVDALLELAQRSPGAKDVEEILAAEEGMSLDLSLLAAGSSGA
jgi:phosphoribosyl 1,2-cyclic phosphodiesterase